jgi:Zn-dependent membrane protease YugP
VKLIMPLEKIGAGLLFLSPLSILITRMPILGMLIFLGGFLTLFTSILVHAVTIPTEIDASFNKAIPLLEKSKILTQDQLKNSKKILLAAAFTYIAVALRSLLDIARWWAILRRR